MQLFGYESSYAKGPELDSSLIFNHPSIEVSNLADWIRPYAVELDRNTSSEHALEFARANIIAGDALVSDEVKEALCLDLKMFDDLRELAHARVPSN
jgi:hypothetical protein